MEAFLCARAWGEISGNRSPMATTFRWVFMSLPMLLLLFLLLCVSSTAESTNSTSAANSITLTRPLRDSGKNGSEGQSLVSPGGHFQLGFFTPPGESSMTCRYLGIWYANISVQTVVWVANRDTPLGDRTGSLKIVGRGGLLLGDRNGTTQWTAKPAGYGASGSPVAELLDDGNFVLRGNPGGAVLWQSFDHPSDTLLPGMKLGGSRVLTSQRSSQDLSPGAYSCKVDVGGYPQLFLWEGVTRKWRTGRWDHGGSASSSAFQFAEGGLISFQPGSRTGPSRLVLNQSGHLEFLAWDDLERRWDSRWRIPENACDDYGSCGPYGVCGVSGQCSCPEGFQRMLPAGSGDDGYNPCQRTAALRCQEGDRFVPVKGVKLPDASFATVEKGVEPERCRDRCSRNCSCVAFAAAEVEGGGGGCLNWFGSLIDLREYREGGRDLYVRLGPPGRRREEKKRRVMAIVLATIVPGLLLILWLSGFCLWKRNTSRHSNIYLLTLVFFSLINIYLLILFFLLINILLHMA